MALARLFALIAFLIFYGTDAKAQKTCSGPYRGVKPDAASIAKVISDHNAWIFSHFERLMGRKQAPRGGRAELCKADLRNINFANGDLSEASLFGADLGGATLSQAFLVGADFSGANLSNANLEGAVLRMSNMEGSNLKGADLREAKLGGANLSGANLQGANLTDTVFFGGDRRNKTDMRAINLLGGDVERVVLAIPNLKNADMNGAIFEPKTGRFPKDSNIHLAINLQGMIYKTSPRALIELRKVFRKSGHRQQERQITYAIRHSQRLQASPLESAYEYVAFEMPLAWGLASGRALLLCALLYLIFSMVYALSLFMPGRAGFIKDGKILVYKGAKSFALPLSYSLLSVLQVNWGGPELCRKVMKIIGGDQDILAEGWLRPAAWIQSALSLYLLVMWFLSAFGRPFE